MNTDITLQIGIDWADRKHDYCLVGPGWQEPEVGIVSSDPEPLHEWIQSLRKRFPEGIFEVAVELSRGALVETLLCYDFVRIYPVNPVSSKRLREALYPSRRKDDPLDANLILDILRKHKDHLRPLERGTGEQRLLEGLVKARRRFVEQRTRVIQKLTANLKGYYPQALKMAGDIDMPMARDFLRRWPTFQALLKSRPQTLVRFYHEAGSRSETCIAKRIAVLDSPVAVTDDPVAIELGRMETLNLVDQLETLDANIQRYDTEIQRVYAGLGEKVIFDSLPGAGKVIAPRMLVAFACHAGQCQSAGEFAAYAGVAPICQKSGRQCFIGKRLGVPKFLHQTLIEYANWSINKSDWARAYYKYRKDVLGQAHWAIMRSLAFKWVRILFRCWETRTPYDEKTYIESLKRRGSTLAANL